MYRGYCVAVRDEYDKVVSIRGPLHTFHDALNAQLELKLMIRDEYRYSPGCRVTRIFEARSVSEMLSQVSTVALDEPTELRSEAPAEETVRSTPSRWKRGLMFAEKIYFVLAIIAILSIFVSNIVRSLGSPQ